FQLNGTIALNLAVGEAGTATVTAANVADGTPVFWTLSNGEIEDGEDGGRVFQGTVVNGTASINFSATGPWARLGPAIITAPIAGRLHYHEAEVHTTAPFSVDIDQWVLAGDKTANGAATLIYPNGNPNYQGQPVWGFGPPTQPYWPANK